MPGAALNLRGVQLIKLQLYSTGKFEWREFGFCIAHLVLKNRTQSKKILNTNYFGLDSNNTYGPQVLRQNFESTPKTLHYFLYRNVGLF